MFLRILKLAGEAEENKKCEQDCTNFKKGENGTYKAVKTTINQVFPFLSPVFVAYICQAWF